MNIFEGLTNQAPKELNNRTPLVRVSNFRHFNCDNCGMVILRHPSQCKGATKCCSKSCAAEIRRERIKYNCLVCGKEMENQPARVSLIKTCSVECSAARRCYDTSRNAPRFGDERLTRDQYCKKNGLTRNQFRYAQMKGEIPAPPNDGVLV